jgi:ADP-ribose pyrophosphatase YjhB (NUDIX family)
VIEHSAGGVLVDRGGTLAVAIARINQRGHLEWTLPEGHIEPGETAALAAQRGVLEETGLSGIAGPPPGTIKYHFKQRGRAVHKFVQHFLLELLGGQISTADHEVSDVAGFRLPELFRTLSYRDERLMLERAAILLEQSVA